MTSILLYAVLGLYVLWVFYLAVTNLMRASKAGALSTTAKVLGAPVLLVGWLLDVVINVAVASFVFAELPREVTLSQRLSRLVRTEGWRKTLAVWLAKTLLNPFDHTGSHIDI